MHRFFIPSSWIQGNSVSITGPQAHQIARVLRMRSGDLIVVLDNSGWEIETRLVAVERDAVKGEVRCRRLARGEPRTKITLYQAVLKSNHFEFALQKGTELGIVEFVPVIADRCVVSDLEVVEKKRRRWEWIIQEAAEQCRRGRKPALRSALLFPRACEEAQKSGGLSLIAWEEEGEQSLRDMLREDPAGANTEVRRESWPPFAVNLFIGPEGGLTAAEIGLARRYGLMPLTMGPRILRSETAGLVAAAVILYEMGDIG
jgi:16S rRNA (uracil1498-N3)-methyltransferase